MNLSSSTVIKKKKKGKETPTTKGKEEMSKSHLSLSYACR